MGAVTNRNLACVSRTAIVLAMLWSGAAYGQTVPDPKATDPAKVDASNGSIEQTSPPATTAASPEGTAEDIVVTGSRLVNAGFAAPTPVTVLGLQSVQQRAPAAIAEALYELPSFNNAGPTQSNRASTAVGFNVLDLRGIGAVRTLVLVDGRRYTPANTTTVFDTNLIPTQLVERTEIVTGGASAAYGSDGVTGVVNFILKGKLEGVQGLIQKGISQQGDNGENVASIAFGHRFGRLHAVFGADYSKNDGVGYPGRGFYSRDWGQNEYGRISLPATRTAGLPANIITANAEYANKTPGSIITSGPLRGTAFGPGGTPYAFQYGSLVGTDQMIGTGNFNFSVTGRQPLRTPTERYVALGRLTYDITDDISVYVEGNYGHSEGTANTAEITIDNLVIRRDNAFLPAATAAAMDAAGLSTITVGRLNEEPGPIFTHNINELKQGTIGTKGEFGGGWRWDAYLTHGENKYHLDVRNVADIPNFRAAVYAVRDGSGNIVCGPVATNPNLNAVQRTQVEAGCVPFNVFGQGSPSAASIDYTLNYMFNDVTAKQTVAALSFAGSPFSTWAGPLTVAFGGEYRRNSALGVADARSAIGANFYGNYKPIDGKITVKEGFGEIGIPLLKDLSFAKALDFNGAVRVTDYSTSGTVVTWKAGLTYELGSFLRLRGTRSRDIRAPNISELYTQGQGGVFTGNNPLTGTSGQAQTTAKGNPNLRPEKADTWTAGIVLSPPFIPNLRVSVDYYKIEIKDVIASLTSIDILNQCYILKLASACALVTQDATPLGFSNITLIPDNLNKFVADGIDIEASYRVPFDAIGLPGSLNVRGLASYIAHLTTTPKVGLVNEQAGGGIPVNGVTGQPQWKWTVNLNYNLDRFFTNVQVRGFSGIKYGSNFVGPEDAGYSPTLSNSINKNRYPGVSYVNLSFGYDVVAKGRQKFQLFMNIDNLLDTDPPFGWIQDIATYDTIGRTFKVGARFGF